MRQLAYDLFVTIGVLCGVATVCVLFGTATGALLRSVAEPAVLNMHALPDDTIVIFDWDHRVTRFVRTKRGPKSPCCLAECLSQADLTLLEVWKTEPMAPDLYRFRLRDVDSGVLHPPNGVWFWSSNDGVQTGLIGGVRFINVRFPDLPLPGSHQHLRGRDPVRAFRPLRPTDPKPRQA